VENRADLLNLRTTYKLKLPHLTREELTKQPPLKDRRKKHYPTTWQDYNRASA
jgi:hypothetical protein